MIRFYFQYVPTLRIPMKDTDDSLLVIRKCYGAINGFTNILWTASDCFHCCVSWIIWIFNICRGFPSQHKSKLQFSMRHLLTDENMKSDWTIRSLAIDWRWFSVPKHFHDQTLLIVCVSRYKAAIVVGRKSLLKLRQFPSQNTWVVKANIKLKIDGCDKKTQSCILTKIQRTRVGNVKTLLYSLILFRGIIYVNWAATKYR